MEKTNWGIIGVGHIASKVVPVIAATNGAVLYACAARDPERAAKFAEDNNIQKSYGDYTDILADPNVDVVYIATPHMNHAELSIRAMKAGKSVLCEKPAAVNATQMHKIIDTSKETGMFFMEGLWTRFQPAFNETMSIISNGSIGKVQAMSADFCFAGSENTGSRIIEPSLAGGALLDVGIYPLFMALSVVATLQATSFAKIKPTTIQSVCRKTITGVDGYESIAMSFMSPKETFISTLTASIDTSCGNHFKSARIIGTKGTIHLPNFWCATEINILNKEGKLIEQHKLPFKINGYEYEVEEVMRCLNQRKSELPGEKTLESPIFPHAATLNLIQIMDSLRLQWGVIYPFEEKEELFNEGNSSLVKSKNTIEFHDEKNKDQIKKTVVKENLVMSSSVTIYTDGACSGNPGRGGWGAVILFDGKECPLSGGEKLTTNNRMELMAAIEALEFVLDKKELKLRPITLISDSQYVKNGIQTWIHSWKKNGWKTANKDPVKNKDLWIELDEAVQQLQIEWKWVKGHAGNKYNEMCDELAVEAGKRQ